MRFRARARVAVIVLLLSFTLCERYVFWNEAFTGVLVHALPVGGIVFADLHKRLGAALVYALSHSVLARETRELVPVTRVDADALLSHAFVDSGRAGRGTRISRVSGTSPVLFRVSAQLSAGHAQPRANFVHRSRFWTGVEAVGIGLVLFTDADVLAHEEAAGIERYALSVHLQRRVYERIVWAFVHALAVVDKALAADDASPDITDRLEEQRRTDGNALLLFSAGELVAACSGTGLPADALSEGQV